MPNVDCRMTNQRASASTGQGRALGRTCLTSRRCPACRWHPRVFASSFTLGVLLAASAIVTAADQSRLDAAAALAREGKTNEARAAYEAIARQDPKNVPAAIALTNLAFQRDEIEKGVEIMEKAVKASPNDSDAHRVLGDAYGRSAQKAGLLSKWGLAKKCLAAYQRAVELDPKNINARYSLFEYYRQAPGMAGGGVDKARAEAEEIRKLDPMRGRLASAQLHLGEKKYHEAFAEFEDVLKTSPDDYSALYQIGRVAALSGERLERGLVTIRRCLELPVPENQPGHAAAHWRIGNILEKKNDPAGARAAYQAALKLDPKLTAAAEALKKLK